MSGTTEDAILSNIPDFASDSGGGASGADDGGSDGRSSAAPTDSGAAGRSSSAPPADGAAAPQTTQAVKRRHDGLVEVPNPQNPNTRDLVDPISGRTVAQGGIERRVFEEAQRHARENVQLQHQLRQAQAQAGGASEVMQEAQRLNVSPEQHVVAIRVMSDFVRDPVKTLEYLVAEVKAKGYQIPFLENGVSQGMDLTAIQRMIDQKMAPLTQQQAAAQQQQKIQADAAQQLNGFISDHPEAEANLDVIAEMMQAQPGLGLQKAYITMMRWAHEHGLDVSQSLKRQIADFQRQQQTTQQPQPTNRPLPGPRSATNGAVATSDTGQFSENASWADIIRHSMRESGIQLQ
jgi:hypothetical protein